jgi:hypothetical protein
VGEEPLSQVFHQIRQIEQDKACAQNIEGIGIIEPVSNANELAGQHCAR